LAELVKQLGRLPGLGPRSAQRVAVHLLAKHEALAALQRSLLEVADKLCVCDTCGNLDLAPVCSVCANPARAGGVLAVVETVADVWALERSGFGGRYHVLGGLVDALAGVGPAQLNMASLVKRVEHERFEEVVMALTASVAGQTTAQLVGDKLAASGVPVTMLAKGMPVGAAVDYLDEGTLQLALRGRQRL
jgi:recombination protein RecR